MFPESRYIIVDLPDVLVLSSVFLSSIYPEARHYFYNGSKISRQNILENDFIFLPHFAINSIPEDICGIVWNEGSMGEMTKEIVDNYFTEMRRIIEPNGLFYNSNRYSKMTNLDYPYKDGDKHIYKGYEEFRRHLTRIYLKRKFRFIPVKLPMLRISHPSILMAWISYLEKPQPGHKLV